MKILQVIPNFCFGGAETMCENLTYSLKAAGHDVTVVSLYNEHSPIAKRMEQAGVKILYLDKKLGADISMVPKLRRIIKQETPDVVHTHLDVIKYAVAAAKLAGVKKCVHTVHNVAHKEAGGRIQRTINKFYYKHGWSTPVALSPEVQETIVSFYGIPKERIPIARNGVDLSKCLPKTDYRIHEPVRIVHIGRFAPAKNHAGLLRAFQKLLEVHPACELTLLGDGELCPDMKTLAAELNIQEKVHFCGTQSNIYPYLQNADIFVLPSIYEGNPMTIIEAMGTGLPIVASGVGGVPDMVEHGQTALLVSCEEDSICAACKKLIADEALRKHLGENAKQHSICFSSEFMAEQYCSIYKN